ncbi:hypothetical protein LTR09_008865 [Extremus antarcticus]|uniref:Uncharacterized protein n=1 Tax=Extremus antarcticus TaxID=702011 RepID=A0AAJ0G6M6_9PEZI|nr:hypothetical protein LTR09_008865 [Extremus antarcticus]
MTPIVDEKLSSVPSFEQATPQSTPPISSYLHHNSDAERMVRRNIESAAERNATILSELMATADAMSALPNSEVSLSRAEDELAVQEAAVESAVLSAGLYRLRYAEKRDNLMTRWFYILTRMRGQLDEHISKAGKAYRGAVIAQSQAEQRQQALRQDLRRLTEEHTTVAARAKRHGVAHKELDELYTSIFSGPTPGFPEEDELERSYDAKRDEHRANTRALRHLTRASKGMAAAGLAVNKSTDELNRALEVSASAFFVSDYHSILMNRAGLFLDQALNLSCEAMARKPFDQVMVATRDSLKVHLTTARHAATEATDSTYLSRKDTLRSIEQMQGGISGALEAQGQLLAAMKRHKKVSTRDVATTSRELEDARQALHAIRQSAFEVTAGFGAAAPAYHECCDRADGFVHEAFLECQLITMPNVTEEGMPPPPSYERATGTDSQAVH